jgi:hypothetical protein
VSAPAGVNAGVTPTPAQPNVAHNDNLNVLGQECKLTIMANGVALDPDKVVSDASFYVGQNVAFSVTNLPPGTRATNFEWSFEGNYFNNQSNAVPVVSFPTCSTVPYVDTSLLSQSVTTNWWVSGGFNPAATYTASLHCTLILSNTSSGQPCSAQGKISMVRPLPDFHAEIRGDVEVGTNHWVNGTFTGQTDLFFGINHDLSNVGIAFIYSGAPTLLGSTNTYGQYFVIQVIDSFSQQYNLVDSNGCAGYITNDAQGLDAQYPYLGTTSSNTSYIWSDAPDTPLTVAHWLSENGSFSTYLMFQPIQSANSRAVPMYKLQWNWSGSATNSPWGKRSGSATNSQAFPTENFPSWTHTINGINTMPQFMLQTNCIPEN